MQQQSSQNCWKCPISLFICKETISWSQKEPNQLSSDFFFFFFKILLLSQDKEQRLSVPLCSTRYCGVASLNKVLGAVMGCSFMVLEETLLLSSTLPELSSGLMLGWESDLSRSPPWLLQWRVAASYYSSSLKENIGNKGNRKIKEIKHHSFQ